MDGDRRHYVYKLIEKTMDNRRRRNIVSDRSRTGVTTTTRVTGRGQQICMLLEPKQMYWCWKKEHPLVHEMSGFHTSERTGKWAGTIPVGHYRSVSGLQGIVEKGPHRGGNGPVNKWTSRSLNDLLTILKTSLQGFVNCCVYSTVPLPNVPAKQHNRSSMSKRMNRRINGRLWFFKEQYHFMCASD